MKLRYIIATLAAAAALFTGCKEEGDTYLKDLRVSSSYVGIPMAGGQVEVKLTAEQAWEVVVDNDFPAWLTIAPLSGERGETNLTFSAEETLDGRNAEIQISCNGAIQRINVIQGLATVSPATVKEVMNGPEKKYRVTAVVTKIHGAHYGNMYLNDGTVEDPGLQIYGSLDKKGNKMTSSTPYDCFGTHENAWDIAVGDKVTVEGPMTIYKNEAELVDVTIIKIEKALVKVIPMDIELDGPDAGDTLIKIACKAESLKVKPNDDWLYVKDIENTTDTVFVRVGFFANEGVVKRTGTLSVTGKGFNDVTITVIQGANAPALMTIAEALQGSYVHVKGKIMAICNRGYVISDATGSLLVYYGNAFDATQFKLGDEMEIISDISAYNYGPQLSCDGKAFDLCEKVSEGTGSVAYPTPKVMDSAACDAILAAINGKDSKKVSDAIKMEFVQIVATPKKSGSYTNIFLDDYTAADFSAYQLPASFDLASMLDKKVTIRGYTQSVSGGKHINIVFTSLEEGAAEEPEDYLVASFAESAEGFTWEDVSLPEGSTYVWKYDATNHYLKASSYFSGTKHASESIAVSPEIDLSDATHAYLSFQHVGKNFASAESLPDMISAEVKVGDTWHKLAAPKMFTNADWTWVGSGDLDMSEYIGQTVRIGFRYVSTADNCGTWEVKEVKVCNYASE